MSLKEQLSRMVTQGSYNSLLELLKIAGIKITSRKKDDMVNALYEFLSKEENIYYIWEALPDYDKEILEEFIRTDGHPDSEELKNNKAIRNKMNKEITNAFELDAKNINTVKRQLEKKNYFCVVEEK